MEVKRAATAGFCMGVSLALHKLDTAIRKNGRDGSPASRICTFGPIIHNPQVLRGYEEKGVACLRDPAEARAGDAVIIRAHGVPRGEELLLKSCGALLMDATCPRVKNAQTAIARATADGSSLLLFGDADHPEVRGLISYSSGPSHVFASLEALQALDLDPAKSWVLASQTTQDATIFEDIRAWLAERLPSLQVLATICDATGERHAEARSLAALVDAMVIVGGRQSGNTRRLAALASEAGVATYHVETADELKEEDFRGVRVVGLTAGASTPKALIDAAEERLRNMA